MSTAPTAVEHGSSTPDNQATRIAVALSIAFIVIAFIGICHFSHRKALLRPLRQRRTVQTRRLRAVRGMGQSAVDRIPMIKYEDHSSSPPPPPPPPPSPNQHHSSHNMWPGQTGPQQGPDTATEPRSLRSRLWRMIRRHRREGGQEEPPMAPSTCSICTEDFRQGDKLRNLACGHLFHPACIDPWLCDRSRTCPLWYVAHATQSPNNQ
ncbi:hypothetical protein PG996_008314 [Apiospora saccharicola]|uniref:RING-type domain-containing protein n=1 Tax=Apiospora saccharicola TaxID=335842 RepID=A0ABR1UXK0_9PEZI